MSEQNVDLVRRAYESFNRWGARPQGDPLRTLGVESLLHPEVEFHTYANSPEAGVYRGREAVIAYNQRLVGSGGSGRDGARRVRNNRDVFRWAEHTGELGLEIEASGERGVYAAAVEAIAELLGAEWGQHAAHRPGMDVETVVEVVPRARLADGVAGLRPIGVIKG